MAAAAAPVAEPNWKLLEQLLNALGTSGSVESISHIMENELKRDVDELHMDDLGNLFGFLASDKPKSDIVLVLCCHMDEVGFMVNHIEPGTGFVDVSQVGGFEPHMMVGATVKISSKNKKSLVSGRVFHRVNDGKELDEIAQVRRGTQLKHLYVDTGFSAAELDKLGVRPGKTIFLDQPAVQFLGPEKQRLVISKALDNRVGCFVLLELARRFRRERAAYHLLFVCTTQEEIGDSQVLDVTKYVNGRERVFALSVDCDMAIVDPPPRGVILTSLDGAGLKDQAIDENIVALANQHKIQITNVVGAAGRSDDARIRNQGTSAQGTMIGVSIRAMHTPFSSCRQQDIADLLNLLYHLCQDEDVITLPSRAIKTSRR